MPIPYKSDFNSIENVIVPDVPVYSPNPLSMEF